MKESETSNPLRPDLLEGTKATGYVLGAFGASRLSMARYRVERTREGALRGEYLEPRKRKPARFSERKPTLVLLDGLEQPEHDRFDRSPDGRTATTRYATFDPAWRTDFAEWLAKYLAENPGVRVLADYRSEEPEE